MTYFFSTMQALHNAVPKNVGDIFIVSPDIIEEAKREYPRLYFVTQHDYSRGTAADHHAEDVKKAMHMVTDQREYTGLSVNYYKVPVSNPTSPDTAPYTAECNDIIEALGMNYAEGNAFKAIWRSCAARHLGLSKRGYDDAKYDAEKVVFFAKRMVEQSTQIKKGTLNEVTRTPEEQIEWHRNEIAKLCAQAGII